MTKIIEPLRPWADDEASSADAGIGELFRSVSEPKPLSAAALARIHARLRGRHTISPMGRRLREIVMASMMLLAGSSLAVAGWGAHDWWRERTRTQAVPSEAAAVAASSVARKRHLPALSSHSDSNTAPLEHPDSPEIAAPAASSSAAPSSTAASTSLNRPAPSSSEASTLAAETAALEQVLFKLRREHDAAGALALLDQSEPLFARSTLALEAKVARVDALLMLGERGQALMILDHLPLAQVGRGGEMRVLRAELRAKDDCARALSDFDALVSQALPLPLAERALYGRAACEVQVGDASHARQDFSQYLARFPNGRFAAAARREVERGTGKAPPVP
jgi:TolA-binding protein